VYFFGEYFETAFTFERYNCIEDQENEAISSENDVDEYDEDDNGEDDDDDDDDDDDSDSNSNDSSKMDYEKSKKKSSTTSHANKKTSATPTTTKSATSSSSSTEIAEKSNGEVIKSADYYKWIYRELSLIIFQQHCVSIIEQANRVGFEKMNNCERLMVAIMGDFCIRKNFFQDKSEKKLATWLTKTFLDPKLSEYEGLQNLIHNRMRCDVCARKFKFVDSNDLSRIECESGHVMARCEKTLLPLDNFKYKKCSMCNSKWNFVNEDVFPHFVTQLDRYSEACLFCDL
jgi:hypothetical protein